MTCLECANLGYAKENGQHVCKWGLNFNQKTASYDVDYAVYCKDYTKINLLGSPVQFSYGVPEDKVFIFSGKFPWGKP